MQTAATPAATPIVVSSEVFEPTLGRVNSTQNRRSAPAPPTATCQARCGPSPNERPTAGAGTARAPAIARAPQALTESQALRPFSVSDSPRTTPSSATAPSSTTAPAPLGRDGSTLGPCGP